MREFLGVATRESHNDENNILGFTQNVSIKSDICNKKPSLLRG